MPAVGSENLLLYYITDRTQFGDSELERRERLLAKVAEAACAGVDYVQLREKDLSSRDLEGLALAVVNTVRKNSSSTRVLINSRTDVALAAGADGVHLRSNDISPADARRIWRTAGVGSEPLVAVSCHTNEEVNAAKYAGADFVVFGPVFGKSAMPGVGLPGLSAACSQGVPVLALGGVTAENAASCIEAGANGIAGIRIFQKDHSQEAIRSLRNSGK